MWRALNCRAVKLTNCFKLQLKISLKLPKIRSFSSQLRKKCHFLYCNFDTAHVKYAEFGSMIPYSSVPCAERCDIINFVLI